jgi:starch synthase
VRVDLLTREYPPEVYGGAGVHVAYLARELRRHVDLRVQCFGAPRGEAGVTAHAGWDALAGEAVLETMAVDLAMTQATAGTDLVHSHTWYANLAGHLSKLAHDVPHVATVHSLEPLRPWKREQLGGGYALSCFCERTGLEEADAVIAVSSAMRDDILACYPAIDPDRVHVVLNGIDTDEYRPDSGTDALERFGIDPTRPSVVFVGRVTRQKGLTHLLDAAARFDPAAQLVLCAGAPDTPEIAAEIAAKVEALRAGRDGVVVIEEMVPNSDVIQLLGHASVFVCPSVYEPLGIVNLEAMACGTPVVATAVGGIPEVVQDGITGLLVPFEPAPGPVPAPSDPVAFAASFADRVNELLADPARAAELGKRGRERAVASFGWPAIAEQVAGVYRSAIAAQD